MTIKQTKEISKHIKALESETYIKDNIKEHISYIRDLQPTVWSATSDP